LCGAHADAANCSSDWPRWETFAQRWVQADGRVLESSLKQDHSTSEGQAYAMFFALVANDPKRFDQLWRWSADNLAGGDPGTALPGWLWGRADDGAWRVEDANSASDADLWMAYSLLEAARLWRHPAYQDDANRLLANIEARELVELPGLGAMLLPGPTGFVYPDQLWRLNPSYLPLPLLRRFAQGADRRWETVARNTVSMIQRSAPHGFAADWVGYRSASAESGSFVSDGVTGDLGSYDAIRVYLWAGMTSASDPLARPLMASLGGMASATAGKGVPPEKVRVLTGETQGMGPPGFSAALIPYFQSQGNSGLAQLQRTRAETDLDKALADQAPRKTPLYYDYMLGLFGLGWAEQRYRFGADGALQPSWESACSGITR
jgi:endoglucanase